MSEYLEERRKYVRLDDNLKVNFQTQNKNQPGGLAEKVSAIITNISVEGVRFNSDRKLEIGEKIDIEIFLPNETKPLHISGKVVWSCQLQDLQDQKIMFESGVKLFAIEKSDEGKFMGYVWEKMKGQLGV